MPAVSWKLFITRRARKDLDSLPRPLQRRIGSKLQWFVSQPDPLKFAERLTKPADGDCRWRIGQYRVILAVENRKLFVLRVQHRKDVYRN